MHNLISRNQLAEWDHFDATQDNFTETTNDYFDCLIECEDDQQTCKRICRRLLD
jgi:hypothetical protein